MDASTINKYKKYSIPKLIQKATTVFNKFIRERDKDCNCISCDKKKELQAGHFYSGGHYPSLKFNENNVHGQCERCNYYLSGDLNNYRINLIKKIGIAEVEKLDKLASYYKRMGFKWDRYFLIEIICKYSEK
jgi:hypothetical protein